METLYFKNRENTLFFAIHEEYGMCVYRGIDETIIQKKTNSYAVELMRKRYDGLNYIESSEKEFVEAIIKAQEDIENTHY